jgi:NADH-quinone oxidoreductase subunit A
VDPFQPLPPAEAVDVGLLSLSAYALLVLGTLAVLLALARWIGAGRWTPEKMRPYESGVVPTGEAALARPLPFYLVASFFLIFDVEAAFLFAWAFAWDALGWAGFLEITFFVGVLLFGLVYLWRKGGLEWGTSSSAGSTR